MLNNAVGGLGQGEDHRPDEVAAAVEQVNVIALNKMRFLGGG